MKKVIILTHPLHYNYGGLMQAYALQKTVRDMGYHVVTAKSAARQPSWKRIYTWAYHPLRQLVWKATGKWQEQERQRQLRSLHTSKFIESHIDTVEFFCGRTRPRRAMANAFDIYIVGSDQVWRRFFMNIRTYFLDFLKNDTSKIKIAYAASFGMDNLDDWTPQELEACRQLIQQFDAVSVREEQGKELCSHLLGREAKWVLDPSMLLTCEQYKQLIPSDTAVGEREVFCYFLDKDEDKTQFAEEVANQLENKVFHFLPDKFDFLGYGPSIGYTFPPVESWLKGFRDADFVITDSFHGTVFSILFSKPFLCIGNPARGTSRFTSLLGQMGLENRLVSAKERIDIMSLPEIDYVKVQGKLNDLRLQSLSFLKEALRRNSALP